MTTAADPHEEFEIAALRRARGALDADGVARLDAHLATCAACRGFSANDAAAATALRRRAQEAFALRDWDKTRGGVRARIRRDRNVVLRLLIWIPVSAAVAWRLGFGSEDVLVVASIAAITVTAATLLWFLPRRRRALQAEQRGAAELLGHYRRDLDREIELLRSDWSLGWPLWLLIMLVGGDVWQMVIEYRAMQGATTSSGAPLAWCPPWGLLVFDVIVWWCIAGRFWYRRLVVLPRLERERQDLGK